MSPSVRSWLLLVLLHRQLYHLDGKPITGPVDGGTPAAFDWADKRRTRRLPDARSHVQSLYLRRLFFVAVGSQAVATLPPGLDVAGASGGVADEEEDEDVDDGGDAGDTGSVMSLLLLHDDASEHVSEATPLFHKINNSSQ